MPRQDKRWGPYLLDGLLPGLTRIKEGKKLNEYARQMISMMNRTGQPQTTTTKVEQPNQGLDIGSLMMMLMLGGMFKDKNPALSTATNSAATNEILGNNLSFGMPSANQASPFTMNTPAASGGMDMPSLIKLIASLAPGGGGALNLFR